MYIYIYLYTYTEYIHINLASEGLGPAVGGGMGSWGCCGCLVFEDGLFFRKTMGQGGFLPFFLVHAKSYNSVIYSVFLS